MSGQHPEIEQHSPPIVKADRDLLMSWYDALSAAFGPQHWWPAETPDEIAIGAVLTQNTSWKNVENAIARLKAADKLSLDSIHKLTESEISELIRPAGTHRIKARRLKALAEFVVDQCGNEIASLADWPGETAREALLGVYGIGPETADAILLYAAHQPPIRCGCVHAADSLTPSCRFFVGDLP